MSRGMALGPIGAAIVVTGVLGPFYHAPMMGSSSLIGESPVLGTILILCACASAYYSWTDKYIRVYTLGYAVLLLSLLSIAAYFGVLSSVQSKLDQIWLGWLGRFLIGHVSLSWGAAAVVAGSFFILGAASDLRAEARAKEKRFLDILQRMRDTNQDYGAVLEEFDREAKAKEEIERMVEDMSSSRDGVMTLGVIIATSMAFVAYGWGAALLVFLVLGMAFNFAKDRHSSRLKRQLASQAPDLEGSSGP